MVSLIVMSKFKDLDISTRVWTFINLITILNIFLVTYMIVLIHNFIGICNNEMTSSMLISYKAKFMAIMLDMTIWKKRIMVIYLHMKWWQFLYPLILNLQLTWSNMMGQPIYKSIMKDSKLLCCSLAFLTLLCVAHFPLHWRREVFDGLWDYLSIPSLTSSNWLIIF